MKYLILLLILFGLIDAEEYSPVEHNRRVYKVLGGWGVSSMAAGSVMLFQDENEVRALGVQSLLWGSVNTGIAAWGLKRTMKKVENLSREEARKRLRRVMLINGCLDVAYITVGLLLYKNAKNDKVRQYRGIGLTVQGGWLLGFDWINFAFTYKP